MMFSPSNKVILVLFLCVAFCSCYRKDKWIVEEKHSNGKPKVKVKVIDDNQKIEKGYYLSGNTQYVKQYSNNMLNGKTEYYFDTPDNTISRIEYYSKGQLHGPYYEFYKDNSLSFYCNYYHGEKIGDCVSYKELYKVEYIREFFIINSESYLSQIISFNSSSGIRYEQSDFVDIRMNIENDHNLLTIRKPYRVDFNDEFCVYAYKFQLNSSSLFTYNITESLYSDSICSLKDVVSIKIPKMSKNENLLLKIQLIEYDKKNIKEGMVPFKMRTLYYGVGINNNIYFIDDVRDTP